MARYTLEKNGTKAFISDADPTWKSPDLDLADFLNGAFNPNVRRSPAIPDPVGLTAREAAASIKFELTQAGNPPKSEPGRIY